MGARSDLGVTFASGNALADKVTRLVQGRVMTGTLTNGTAISTSACTYDGSAAGPVEFLVLPAGFTDIGRWGERWSRRLGWSSEPDAGGL